MELYEPLVVRMPLGRAVKPLELVAPSLDGIQWRVPASFNFPPATSSPPRKVVKAVQSESVGTCQPVGHTFLPPLLATLVAILLSTTYQLYSLP